MKQTKQDARDMRFKDWTPPLCRATWFAPGHLTERERILCAALDGLITHDTPPDGRRHTARKESHDE
jgi:hypothetical protein